MKQRFKLSHGFSILIVNSCLLLSFFFSLQSFSADSDALHEINRLIEEIEGIYFYKRQPLDPPNQECNMRIEDLSFKYKKLYEVFKTDLEIIEDAKSTQRNSFDAILEGLGCEPQLLDKQRQKIKLISDLDLNNLYQQFALIAHCSFELKSMAQNELQKTKILTKIKRLQNQIDMTRFLRGQTIRFASEAGALLVRREKLIYEMQSNIDGCSY